MIDPLEVLRFVLRDFGQAAAIDGVDLENGVLFNHAPAQADPYLGRSRPRRAQLLLSTRGPDCYWTVAAGSQKDHNGQRFIQHCAL